MQHDVGFDEKLYEELKKYGVEDLHDSLYKAGIDSWNVWNLTNDQLGNILENRYWNAERKKRKRVQGGSGHGKYNEHIILSISTCYKINSLSIFILLQLFYFLFQQQKLRVINQHLLALQHRLVWMNCENYRFIISL